MLALVFVTFMEFNNMFKNTIVRLVGIALITLSVCLMVRELFYWKTVDIHSAMIAMNTKEIMEDAPLVVRGVVKDNLGTVRYTDWTGETVVGTRWKVQVTTTLKGHAPKEIVVRVLGGRYGLTETNSDDDPKFTEGDDVVLFLDRYPFQAGQETTDLQVVGGIQGYYEVNREGTYAMRQGSDEKLLISR